MPSDRSRAASTSARNPPATQVRGISRTGRSMRKGYDQSSEPAQEPARRPRTAALASRRWSDASSDSRTSTASPAPFAANVGSAPTRSPATCSAGWCRWGRSSNVFLENGARLYLDVGSHPEYATPECDSIADLVVHDKAGERILEGLVRSAEQRLREEGIRGEVYLFKNNTDSAGNSYGCHENYLVERDGDFAKFTDVLIPFLVTRQVYAGAGKVLQTARGAMYCVSQRAEHIWEGVSSATTRSRPIINTRDEPHADAERFRRLHVIVGDSNMSEYTTFLKVGATSIVLRMLEEDSRPWRDLTLENPIRAIREISHDITCRRRVRLANGRELSAVEIQSEYLQRALQFAKRRGLSPLEEQALAMWEHVMTHLENDPLKLVDRGRLGDQVPPDRGVPRAARPAAHAPARRAARPRLPRRHPGPVALLPARAARRGRAHRHRRGRSTRPRPRRRRPRGPGCAARSSSGPRSASATTPSTGCT